MSSTLGRFRHLSRVYLRLPSSSSPSTPKLSSPSPRYRMASGGGSPSDSTLESLNFVNGAIKSLPVEDNKDNYVRTVQGACFSAVRPTPLKNPKLVCHSLSALSLLGVPASEVAREEFVQYFSGNKIMPGSEPAAHCYCGHQFGNFAGQLGDGCAILLGEVKTRTGERWEVQLKGSGKTPFSRSADGRKVLRSSIREFLCSEAMHHLGIPTTRAGTCITSDDYVERDIFYNGNVIQERATVISRIAPSFIRFGSFEIFKPRDLVTGRTGPSVGMPDLLHQLVDYVIQNFYPEVYSAHKEDSEARTEAFFREVCLRTARLVALWQCVGFCHGVLNTDNMSILGLTIDYGPYGFLDRFDPDHICNGSDDRGRYAYDQQPAICRWNLRKLAEALAPNGLSEDMAKEGLKLYDSEFNSAYLSKMRLKLGLIEKKLPEDGDLVESLLETMQKTGCDFTNGFQCLSSVSDKSVTREDVMEKLLEQCATPEELVNSFKPTMRREQLEMMANQPPLLLQALGFPLEVIQAELQKLGQLEKLKKLSVQEKLEEDRKAWMSWLTTYRDRLKLETDAISDEGSHEKIYSDRLMTMNNNNPRIVLRNHIAQKAIDMAEQGDYSEVYKVLKMLESPYDANLSLTRVKEAEKAVSGPSNKDLKRPDSDDMASLRTYLMKPPLQSLGLCVT